MGRRLSISEPVSHCGTAPAPWGTATGPVTPLLRQGRDPAQPPGHTCLHLHLAPRTPTGLYHAVIPRSTSLHSKVQETTEAERDSPCGSRVSHSLQAFLLGSLTGCWLLFPHQRLLHNSLGSQGGHSLPCLGPRRPEFLGKVGPIMPFPVVAFCLGLTVPRIRAGPREVCTMSPSAARPPPHLSWP